MSKKILVVECIDAGNTLGQGNGLLTVGKRYTVIRQYGGYYDLICDNGKEYSKLIDRFKIVKAA